MSKFIGRRIVPKHDGVWDINKEYEELSIVLDKASGESYISRRPVPVGTAISDEIYWMQYSLYSAQIAEAVKEMEDTEARLIQYVDTAESNMNSRVNSAESLTNSNKAELNSRMDTLDKRLDAEKVYEEQVVRAFRKAVLERFRLTLKPIHDNVAVADIMSGRFKEQYDNFTPEADSFCKPDACTAGEHSEAGFYGTRPCFL